ncbi:FAS1 domain-containing protein [Poronia punctata]|nr:FAS1 domain-containing protein [Poronia punctata]
MRYTKFLPFVAATATAIVIPDETTAQQLALEVGGPVEKAFSKSLDALHSVADSVHDVVEEVTHRLDIDDDSFDIDPLGSLLDGHYNGVQDAVDGVEEEAGFPGHPHRHPNPTNLTIYQAIQASNYTKRFAALVDDFPDIVELLNSTSSNITAFVPVDKAFERLPEDYKPPKEFIEALLQYHVAPELYQSHRLFVSHTLPTTLKSKALGGRPQRLRVNVQLGLRINLFTRILVGNLMAKNGVIHGIDRILVPPPTVRRDISGVPSMFSTLELAALKTGLLPHHDHGHHGHHGKDGEDGQDEQENGGHDHDKDGHHHLTGLTVFAPDNLAWVKLGPAANFFLFNTEKGLGYLRALLKYHIVVNETLYSDAYYGLKEDSEESFENQSKGGSFHVDLPTLLGDRSLSIDIVRHYSIFNMRVNGYTNVALLDCLAYDGVVQVLHSVLIPPRDPKQGSSSHWEGEISVDELVERLQPYVEEEYSDYGETTETDPSSPNDKEQEVGEL